MKYFAIAVIFFSLQSFASDIIGEWKFSQIILDGKTYPMPNPDLDLRMTFSEDGNSRLFWSRAGEEGFCERRALYYYDSLVLYQLTVWVNPLNDFECQKDPDMQMSKETRNHVRIQDKKLFLDLQLSDKILTYVMFKVP